MDPESFSHAIQTLKHAQDFPTIFVNDSCVLRFQNRSKGESENTESPIGRLCPRGLSPTGTGGQRGWSEAIAPSGARPGRVFERSENTESPIGRLCPRGLSPTGDWGIIEYSHPVLKDSAQGWLLLNDVFGISGCYCKGSRMIGPEKSFSVLRFVKVLMYVTPSSTYWKFTLSVIQSYLYSLLSRSSN